MTSCGEFERYALNLHWPSHVCGHLPLKSIHRDQRHLNELFYANEVLYKPCRAIINTCLDLEAKD